MTKREYELLAMMILKSYIGNPYNNLALCDKPDLQADENSIGMEVTRGISSSIGHMQSIIDRGISQDGLLRCDIEKLNGLGIVHEGRMTGDGRKHVSIMPNDSDLYKSILIIIQSIIEKNNKLISGDYKRFNIEGLFIYIENPIIELGNCDVIVQNVSNRIEFGRLFFFTMAKELIEYNLENKEVKNIKDEGKYRKAYEV